MSKTLMASKPPKADKNCRRIFFDVVLAAFRGRIRNIAEHVRETAALLGRFAAKWGGLENLGRLGVT